MWKNQRKKQNYKFKKLCNSKEFQFKIKFQKKYN